MNVDQIKEIRDILSGKEDFYYFTDQSTKRHELRRRLSPHSNESICIFGSRCPDMFVGYLKGLFRER